MKFKNLLISSMSVLMLAGCSATTPTANNDIHSKDKVVGITTEGNITNYFEQDIVDKVKNNSPLGYYSGDSFLLAGTELKEYKFETVDGTELNTNDLKGKKVVYEFVAPWCGYCSEFSKDHAAKIEAANPDIQFVQLFADGTREDIAKFLVDANRKFDAPNATGVVFTDEVTRFAQDVGIQSFPTFIFVDESGRISWSNSGSIQAEEFDGVVSIAFEGKKVYESLKDNLSEINLKRTSEDVRNDLTDEANEKIELLFAGDPSRAITVYENIGKIIRPDSIYTMEEKSVPWDQIKNEKIVYTFLSATFDTNDGNKESFDKLKEIATKHPEYTFVNIILPVSEESPTDFIKNNGIELPGYTIDGTHLRTAEELYDLYVYYVPTMIFASEGGYIEGATTGLFNETVFEQAKEMFFGKHPISTMLKPQDDNAEEKAELKNPEMVEETVKSE